ncbi:MAG: GtrA family protein [Filimonas sp.]|nr:GtrA family protein [Filimonas sp.]
MDWLIKFVKFGVVGFSGMIIDFGITWLCKERLKLNKFVANSCGFTLAVINNYILNRIWTFESSNPQWQQELGKFVLISLVGLLLNNLLLFLFHSKLKLNFYLAKAIAIGCVVVWNFGINMLFTFNK